MEDVRAIESVVVAVMRAFDDHDWPALRSHLAPTLDFDYTALRGGNPERASADVYVARRRDALSSLVTQHLASNLAVAVEVDRAECRCEAVIRRWPRDPADARFFHTYAACHYRLIRLGDVWRIEGIRQEVRRNEGAPSLHVGVRSASGADV